MNYELPISKKTLRIAVALSKGIEELGLTKRSYNGLRRWGVNSVADLCEEYINGSLPRVRNMGEKSIFEVEHALYVFFVKHGVVEEEENERSNQ